MPIALLTIGCVGTIPQQIRDQGGSALDVNRATYLQALSWYNDAQEDFIYQVQAFDPQARKAIGPKIVEINGLFSEMGGILDVWRDATTLADMDVADRDWRALRNRLIDAGLNFIIKRGV